MKAVHRPHTIASRLSDEEAALLDSLAAVMNQNQRSLALRWLLGQPEVKTIINRQIQASRSMNVMRSVHGGTQ